MRLFPTGELTVLQRSTQLLDPHVWTDDRDRLSIRRALFEALVRYDARGSYRPALATSWSLSPDACTWTFQLRPGVRFQNGQELVAHTVVAALNRARGPEVEGELGTSGLYQSYLGKATVRALDASTIQIITDQPMADLLDLLVEIPIVADDPMVGTGPFRVVGADNAIVLMEAFDAYWGSEPKVERIRWQRESDDRRRAEALLCGQADVVGDLAPATLSMLRKAPQCEVLSADSKWATVFMCNIASGVCTDRKVRQALNYALDVPRIIRIIQPDGARPLNGPLTPLHFGYDPSTPPYPHDPAKARSLLSAAGYNGGLRLVLDVPARLPDEAQQLAEIMAEQYGEVGIAVDVQVFTDRVGYAQMVKAKQMHDACCFDSSPLSTWRVLREKFHSGVAGVWWQGFVNAKVDMLLDQAAEMPDDALRQDLYRRAYRLIRDDAPWIFLYSPVLSWGMSSRGRCLNPGIDGVIELV
jgi:peptide/nickel transport system substrate-binding protein